jgi:hypothetical protein
MVQSKLVAVWILASVCGAFGFVVAHAQDGCLIEPNSPAPPGSHWYYHFDAQKQAKCWYLRTAQPAQKSATTTQHRKPAVIFPREFPIETGNTKAGSPPEANSPLWNDPPPASSAMTAGPALPSATTLTKANVTEPTTLLKTDRPQGPVGASISTKKVEYYTSRTATISEIAKFSHNRVWVRAFAAFFIGLFVTVSAGLLPWWLARMLLAHFRRILFSPRQSSWEYPNTPEEEEPTIQLTPPPSFAQPLSVAENAEGEARRKLFTLLRVLERRAACACSHVAAELASPTRLTIIGQNGRGVHRPRKCE